MAILSEFLGNIVASVSNARVHSDIQTIQIAQEYAKNDLLQHFAVPRMRFSDVEIKIPVALESMKGSQPKQIESIDKESFLSIAYTGIIKTLDADKLPLEISNKLKTSLALNIEALETRLKENEGEKALREFADKMASEVILQIDLVWKLLKRKSPEAEERIKLQNKISDDLQGSLQKEIKLLPGTADLSSLNVIIEADKLREIKPEYIMMITMKISEEGMEWHKLENSDGRLISKLMPE